MRILIVVLSLDREPWRRLEQAQRETWAQPAHEGVELRYLQGTASSARRTAFLMIRQGVERLGLRLTGTQPAGIPMASMTLTRKIDAFWGRFSAMLPTYSQGNVIRTKTLEYWVGTSAKMHAGLRHVVTHHEFDYLVRTNSSTYIHLPSLIEHLKSAPSTKYYAGADIGEPHAHGTCIILSRDAAEDLSRDFEWDYDTVDDAAVGRAAARAGLRLYSLREISIGPDSVNNLGPEDLAGTFIWRVKTRGNRDRDIETLHSLHRAYASDAGPALLE